jgi:hypothetical protein
MAQQTLERPVLVPLVEQPIQVLIKEARQHQHRRWLIQGALGFLIVAAVLTWLGVTTLGGGVGHGRSQSHRSTPPTVAAGSFAGTWSRKYYDVRIAADGQGLATWPIKVICGRSLMPNLRPCDTESPTGVVHEGGRARIRLVSITGTRALAIVSSSTETSLLPDGGARFSLSPNDVVYITPDAPTSSSPYGRSSFCGPLAASLSFPQQEAEHIDCAN